MTIASMLTDMGSSRRTTNSDIEELVVCLECNRKIPEQQAYKTVSGFYVCKDKICMTDYLDTVE